MNFVQIIKGKWCSFLNYIIKNLTKMAAEDVEKIPAEDELKEMAEYVESETKKEEEFENDRFVINKRSMLTRLNSMEQLIKTFDEIFPESYLGFLERIELLKQEYQESLEEYIDCLKKGALTFEIDPDEDSSKIADVINLEKEINSFVENDLKFYLISRRIQKMCLKLNILYNTSIRHSTESDKTKVLAQVERAKENISEIVEDVNSYEFFSSDKVKRDYLIDFISYADYLVFKCSVRNLSYLNLKDIFSNLFINKEFDGLDFTQIFKDFVLEELENLSALLSVLLKNEEYYLTFLRKIQKLQNFNYDASFRKVIETEEYWLEVIDIENSILNCLTLLGFEKERIEIILLDRFDAGIDEKEVFFSVKSQACLAIADVFYKTQNVKSQIVLKVISNLNSDITYKDVYFILLLFDLIEVIKSTKGISKSFLKGIKKQEQKYGFSYTRDSIESKKQELLSYDKQNKTYVKVFSATNSELERFRKILRNEKFDFIISCDDIYLNSFYFQGFENIMKSLNDIKTIIN